MKKKIRYQFTLIMIALALVILLSIPVLHSFHQTIAYYGKHELEYFTSMIVNHASFQVDEGRNDTLIQIAENSDGSIKSVDYDLLKANKIASSMALGMENLLLQIQNGHYQKNGDTEFENILYQASLHKGLITHISLANVIKMPILAYLLPSVPIYYEVHHAVGSSLRPVIEDYGINQVAVILYADITIRQTMIIPFFEDDIIQEFSIPIALRIVNGEVPQFYVTN